MHSWEATENYGNHQSNQTVPEALLKTVPKEWNYKPKELKRKESGKCKHVLQIPAKIMGTYLRRTYQKWRNKLCDFMVNIIMSFLLTFLDYSWSWRHISVLLFLLNISKMFGYHYVYILYSAWSGLSFSSQLTIYTKRINRTYLKNIKKTSRVRWHILAES